MKYSLLILLFLYADFCAAQKKITQNGNTILCSKEQKAEVLNPVNGKLEHTKIPGHPAKLNGVTVYPLNKITDAPTLTIGDNKTVKLSEYLFIKLRHELEQLEDGRYILSIENPVVNKDGKLVYYKLKGVQQQSSSASRMNDKTNIDGKGATMVTYSYSDKQIPAALCKQINEQARALLENLPAMTSPQISGKPVSCTGELFNTMSHIKVKDHQAEFEPCYFCL